jgi:hypothetical protein
MKPLPLETWKPFPLETVVEVPFSCRDAWGRDVVEAEMIGAPIDLEVGPTLDFDLTLVPAELVTRVRYDGELYTLMVGDPHPQYWREAA